MAFSLSAIDTFIEMSFKLSTVADLLEIQEEDLREICSQEGILFFDERVNSLYSCIGESEWLRYEVSKRLNIDSMDLIDVLKKIQAAGLPEKCPIKHTRLSYKKLSKDICCDSAVIVCSKRPYASKMDVYVVSFAAFIEGETRGVTLKDSVSCINTVVSSDGSIYTLGGKKRKSPSDNRYARSSFKTEQGKWKIQYHHKLVCECFLNKSNKKFEIDHKNRDKSDNRVENLRYVSKSTNVKNQDFENKLIRPCVTTNIETGMSVSHKSASAAAKYIGSSASAVKKVLDNQMHQTQGHKIDPIN
jgi:hypothetical protein